MNNGRIQPRPSATNGLKQVADVAPAVNGGEVAVRDARHDRSRDEAVVRSIPTLLRVLIITQI